MKFFAARKNVNMTEAPFMKKLIIFAIPLVLSGILQLLYNSADLIVVGQFSRHSSDAQAAISSTSSIIHLIINLFMGLSVGINVACAKSLGARDGEKAQKAVHTSFLVSIIGGVLVGAFGFAFSDDILRNMQCPENILPLSTLYLKIFFVGTPFNIWYNFGAAILRSKGDTQKPLIFLAISGAVNVALNLFFVLVMDMSVDGVAIATVTSQILSAVMVTFSLVNDAGDCKLSFKKLGIDGKTLWEIVKVGLPSGIQTSLFSLSNVIIQSSVNTFGAIVMAGNGNAQYVEAFIGISVEAIGQAAVAFIAQNLGARNKDNVKTIMKNTFLLMTVACIILSGLVILLRRQLLYIFSKDEAVADAGQLRIMIMVSTYLVFGWMTIFVAYLRGLGNGLVPMIISVVGIVGFRFFWIYVVFANYPTLTCIYMSYPISWVITGLFQMTAYFIVRKKVFARLDINEELRIKNEE